MQDVYSYSPNKNQVVKPHPCYAQNIRWQEAIFKTEAMVFIDAENASNTIKRKVLLQNTAYLCLDFAVFIYNCYVISAWFLVIGGKEIGSCAETNQGDPTAIATYAIGLTPLLNDHQSIRSSTKNMLRSLMTYGKLDQIQLCWDHQQVKGPFYGYYPKPSISYTNYKTSVRTKCKRINFLDQH